MKSNIRNVFGDNNIRSNYIQHLLNPRKKLPPFPPVLYRQTNNITMIDGYNMNHLSKHNTLNIKLMEEFHRQYPQYQIILQNNVI